MRNFALETFFSTWEFSAKHHMTASDAQSVTISELLELGGESLDNLGKVYLGYTETWGAPSLRTAIAKTYENLDAENILCFAGAEEGVYAAMRVLLSESDHAIVVVPNYQAAETLPLDICQVSGVALNPDDNWSLNLDHVERAIKPNTKLVSVCFPNNPTGKIMPADDWAELISLCRKHDLYLFSDEVYRLLELDPGKRIDQAADVYEKGLSLNVMSKAYGLPGLRIGWIATQDKQVLQELECYKHYLSICNSAPSEWLAEVALSVSDQLLQKNRSLLSENREKLNGFFDRYTALFEWQQPDGGCISYPRFIGRGGVESFCQNLVEESGVLLLPASIYRSELMSAPTDRFRIGFGRANMDAGLAAFTNYLEQHLDSLTP
jgi:aspartate/methionine/tyrosine aminotransferase